MGHGPRTVVLIHGLFANMAEWYFSLAPALARTHQVVLYDMRGHGLSSRTAAGYGIRAMSSDLEAVIDSVSAAQVSLVGFSFGAAVALRYACDHPGRVGALVAVEPPLPMDIPSVETWARSLQSASELIEDVPALRRVAASGRRSVSRLVRGVGALLEETSLRREIAAEPDIADDDLRALASPTLVCYGLDSPIGSSGTRERLQALLPRSRQVTIPGGHFLPAESPQRLRSLVVDFLEVADGDLPSSDTFR